MRKRDIQIGETYVSRHGHQWRVLSYDNGTVTITNGKDVETTMLGFFAQLMARVADDDLDPHKR